jgi:hypothetical protein
VGPERIWEDQHVFLGYRVHETYTNELACVRKKPGASRIDTAAIVFGSAFQNIDRRTDLPVISSSSHLVILVSESTV